MNECRRTLASTFVLVCVCVLLAVGSCAPRKNSGPVGRPEDDPSVPEESSSPDTVSLFFTGNELGALKPCGCTGGQLGGLSKRAPVLSAVADESRLIVDTGALVEDEDEQALIKFNIINRAFDVMGYDAVNLTARDLRTARNLGLLVDPPVPFASAYQAPEQVVTRVIERRFILDEVPPFIVRVVPFDPQMAPVSKLVELLSSRSDTPAVNVVLLNSRQPQTLDQIEELAVRVDCVVCPAEGDEPVRLSANGERPIVFTIGRRGKYVCRVDIVEPPQSGTIPPEMRYEAIPGTEDIDPDEELVRLYTRYQEILRQSDLLRKHPRVPLENGLKYVGSQSCAPCHEKIFEHWKTTQHASAWATLDEVGSEADPECITCHVIGFDYEEGFITKEKTPELINVGCENCHGPGSKHVGSAGVEEPGRPRSVCLDCHTPEHSGPYAGNREKYWEKIKHW